MGKGKAIGLAVLQALQHSPQPMHEPSLDVNVKALHYIVNHPERFALSELEKDFIRIAFKRYQANESFSEKYSVYFKEIVLKLRSKSNNIAI